MKQIKLRLHTWPDKSLRTSCSQVTDFSQDLSKIFNEMTSLMRVCDGVGLAANQAGLGINLVVIEFQEEIYKLINPRIIKREGSLKFTEGCLSFPEVEVQIKRSAGVWVSYQDLQGCSHELKAQGVLAVILQHEVDHIQGKTIIRKISREAKQRLAEGE